MNTKSPLASVQTARAEELAPALRLIFQASASERAEGRVANVLEMIRVGEFDPAGVFVLRGRSGVEGAVVCQVLPGAGGLIWPPATASERHRAIDEDQLIQHARERMKGWNVKLFQCLLGPEEEFRGNSLARNGFQAITTLWYLRHDMELSGPLVQQKEYLRFEAYRPEIAEVFHQTLLETYQDSMDCPEVTGVRTLEEILEGHQGQGNYDPDQWWLALSRQRAIGVVLLAEVSAFTGWDLCYLGLVPRARGHGLGKELVTKALIEAKAKEARQLTLAVDDRNKPAWNLYRRMGFEPYDQRRVYLAIL